MKIIHIITCIDRGGAENQVVQMLLEQKKNSLDIVLIFLKGNGFWVDYLKSKGIKVIGPIFPKGNYLSLKGYEKLKKILPKRKFIVHLHMPPSLMVGVILKYLFNFSYKIIYTSHNEAPFIKFPIIEFFFSKLLLECSDYIISIADSGKRNIIKRYMINPNKILVINYCFNKSIYTFKKNKKLDEFKFYKKGIDYIGTVARLVPQKRIDLLIKSFAIISRKQQNLRLVIIGSGYLKPFLKKTAFRYKISEDSIIWVDYTENVILHMQRWKLFCLTSAYEGFGLVLLEAIFAKIPILAMDVSSIKNIIGQCGEMVPFGEYKLFSEKIISNLNGSKIKIPETYLDKYSPFENFLSHEKLYKIIFKK